MNKKWILHQPNQQAVEHLQEVLQIDKISCQLLAQRGITTFETAKDFFRPNIKKLHDPFLMKDMENAVNRLTKAIEFDEPILIYGDYDVDGTTSVAMMYQFLSNHHKHLEYYIPDRYKEGYGISMQGIDYAKQNGINLIISIDCGINAIAPVQKAKELGIDFIICDHHLPKENLPQAVAVLDPKRKDCNYPFKDLSGCGVAFKLIQAFLQKHQLPTKELNELLDLLVISIACDIVPIVGENRILAHFGLKKLNTKPRSGIRALIQVHQRNYPFSISDIVFGIGPSINAAGRLSDAKLSVRLLLANDKKVALHLAEELKHKNDKRKDFEYEITRAAMHQVTQHPDWNNHQTIVVFGEDWHKGVVGIVASKLVDKFHKPSIVLTKSNGQIVGSARSIRGFDVHQAIQQCEKHLINFGGHQYAAGLTIKPDALEHFKNDFEKAVVNTIKKDDLIAKEFVAAYLDFNEITPKFLRILQQFAPFGPSNRRPVFATRSVKDAGRSKVLKNEHLRLDVQQADKSRFQGIGFGLGGKFDIIEKEAFDICYVVEENVWKGKKRLQLRVKDVKTVDGRRTLR
ncbi:MAG: single-stranded-DNA-specific exonuclease RecJ [Saprospiraceae bacterium]